MPEWVGRWVGGLGRWVGGGDVPRASIAALMVLAVKRALQVPEWVGRWVGGEV